MYKHFIRGSSCNKRLRYKQFKHSRVVRFGIKRIIIIDINDKEEDDWIETRLMLNYGRWTLKTPTNHEDWRKMCSFESRRLILSEVAEIEKMSLDHFTWTFVYDKSVTAMTADPSPETHLNEHFAAMLYSS